MFVKRLSLIVSGIALSFSLWGQAMGTAVATFLDYPVSAHVAALGGSEAAYMGDDRNFAALNPALLASGSGKSIDLNYSFYMGRTSYGSGSYAMELSDYDRLQVGLQFAQYGKVDGYDVNGVSLGTYSAQDFALVATYSRQLNRYFSIGASLKPILSHYADYTDFSLGADMGVQFADTAHLLAVGLAVRNLGGRLYGAEELTMTSRWLPMHVNLSFTKRFRKAPFALHFTLQDSQKWNYDYGSDTGAGKVSAGMALARKIVIGVDVVPRNDRFWLALSYNLDRGLSLRNPYVISAAGLSAGGGVRLYAFRIGLGISVFGSSAVTTHLSLAMDLDNFRMKKL